MSCGNPISEEEGALMEKRTKFDRSTWCIKCKTQRGNLVIRHAVFCKSCFFQFVITKFRRCIEPHINESAQVSRRTALNAAGNLLVGFSGGMGSTVLLDLLSCTYFPPLVDTAVNGKGGRGHPRNRRVWTKTYACYVETCNAFPEMRDRSDEVGKFFEQNEHFELISARIEDAFDSKWWNTVGGRPSAHSASTTFSNEDLPLSLETPPTDQAQDSPVSRLRSYLASLPTQTAVHSSISTLSRIILIYTAHHLRCSHLALGTSLTSLSVSLISGIAQGGGFNVREEYFEEWQNPANMTSVNDRTRAMPVRIVRPLHDIGMKECAAWVYWKGLRTVGKGSLPSSTGKQTIGSLTKDFIIGLERDYPSTVSTIVRTCSKVEARDEGRDRCVLCERVMPGSVLGWKRRISVRSTTERDSFPPITIDETKRADRLRAAPASLSPHLCYACHTHLTGRSSRSVISRNSVAYLPQWTNAHLTRSLQSDTATEDGEVWSTTSTSEEKMKTIVGDFLL